MYSFGGCKLRTITSFITVPFTVSDDTFGVGEDAVLYVPKGTKSKYESTDGWNKFKNIVEITQKCETPTIIYTNGQLKFECETEGVEFKTTITDADIRNYTANTIDLTATYNISVYTTRTGYDNSDVVSATLCWIDSNPTSEGITEGLFEVKARSILVQTDEGVVSISGANEGEQVTVYDINGIYQGTAVVRNNTARVPTFLSSKSVAIIKIGHHTVKVMMK